MVNFPRACRRAGATLVVAALVLLRPWTPVAADVTRPVSFCIDSSSPTAGMDRRVATAVAALAHAPRSVYEYDGTYGVSEKLFRSLVRERCELLLGYPVDSVDPDPPRGLALTHDYFRTGYVLVSLRRPLRVATIPRGSTVAVGLGTVPNFFLVGALGTAPPLKADAYQSQEEAIAALLRGTDAAAMLWEPSILRYRATHPGMPHVAIAPLPISHDRWALAALFDPKRSSAAARRFERAIARLAADGTLATLTNSPSSEFAQ